MFKKPLGNLKTSSPLRNSDRKKLRNRITESFSIPVEDAGMLVPEGILSVKFSTHLNEQGLAYLSPDGNPLWFTVGKGSEDMIPTVYTLWKNPRLLPFLSTPKAVIPILVGGADLMIPGVVHHTPSLKEGQLVSVCKYESRDGTPTLSPPLAVGRLAVSSDQLADGGREKGKAVIILHTWKDHLWEMGNKSEPPEDVPIQRNGADAEQADGENGAVEPSATIPNFSYTPEEISDLLHKSLLQALATTLSNLPTSAFPITSTTFNTSHILPARPNFPSLVVFPSSAAGQNVEPWDLVMDPRDIIIKASTHKSLTAFLKSAEKASLLSTKTPPKQSDLLITSVNAKHPDVQSHKLYATVGEVEAKAAKKAKKEEIAEKEREKEKAELDVQELWKPHGPSVALFEGMGGSSSKLYTITEIRDLLNAYIASKELVNKHEQAYINLDGLLVACVSAKASQGKGKKAREAGQPEEDVEFMKRVDLTKKIVERMQNWYIVSVEGKDVVPKKGKLEAINVTTKIRQGRKACTLITGFEPFHIDAEEMAEDLKRVCAGATSVSPIPGKPAGAGLEVLVQGKQTKAVTEYLLGKGVSKKWIEVADMTGKK
ncbi:eukaryotic translation initiation factor sui1 family protein [Moniliophthora roreri MCA 2997]|uniref:Eukaryotic translation initiation factor sui1 family protein n=1 Tax=Moniliophthora roreri (strain MCA 2997) TaxID=1381753 RepID=V2WYC6_MONRO|nr:eukaryotic translation initiation factor sui1 family protein [Moniliophthora roreri MCA 2997]